MGQSPQASDWLEYETRIVGDKPHGYLYDNEVTKLVSKNFQMTVPWMLLGAFAYYKRDNPLITDDTYDVMKKMAQANFKKLTHIHTHLIHDNGIVKTSLFDLREDEYPSRMLGAYRRLAYLDPKFNF